MARKITNPKINQIKLSEIYLCKARTVDGDYALYRVRKYLDPIPFAKTVGDYSEKIGIKQYPFDYLDTMVYRDKRFTLMYSSQFLVRHFSRDGKVSYIPFIYSAQVNQYASMWGEFYHCLSFLSVNVNTRCNIMIPNPKTFLSSRIDSYSDSLSEADKKRVFEIVRSLDPYTGSIVVAGISEKRKKITPYKWKKFNYQKYLRKHADDK